MRIEKWYTAFMLTLSVLFVSSCSDDDYNPITLWHGESIIEIENGWANLYLHPHHPEQSYNIKGGDGQYVIENVDKEVVTVNYDGKTLFIKPIGVGYSSIHIRDNSNHILTIYLTVDYSKNTYNIVQCFSYVEGDNLTIKEKKQLEEEIVKTIPVAPQGRYEFTYSNPNENGGEVKIYPTVTTSRYIKGTFLQENIETEDGGYYNQITIRVEEKEWILVNTHYFNPNTRAIDTSYPMMFVENVTDKFKQQYPALEKAYAMQAYFMR